MACIAITQVEGESAIAALVRHAAAAGIAGAVSGVIVGGIGGRVLMRISAIAADRDGFITENGNRIGDITAGGTLGLVIFVGIFGGITGAIAYLISEPWLEWTGRWHAPAFALVLLAVTSRAVLVPENLDFALLGNRELNVAMFIALFVGFSLLLRSLLAVLDARLPRARALLFYLLLVALGALMGPPLIFFTFVSEDACGCEPAFAIGGFVLAMAVSTLALWFVHATDRLDARWLPRLRLVGYATLAGTLVTGGIRFLSDVSEIL